MTDFVVPAGPEEVRRPKPAKDAGGGRRRRNLRPTRERIFVSGRLCDEHAAHRAELLNVVRATFPDGEILDGVSCWQDNDDWLSTWPELLPTLDRVIVLPGPRGEVGLGVLQEALDALLARIPVEIVTAAGVHQLGRVRLGTDVLDFEDVASVEESRTETDAARSHGSTDPHAHKVRERRRGR